MPFTYKKQGNKYVVYKKSGERVGATGGTKKELKKYLSALHVHSKDEDMKKENMEIPGPGYDNQIGDIYAVQKPVTHDCACTDLIHKVDPITGIQSMGIEPDQIHGIYNDEMVANQIAEKIHKEFVDAALALEKKKHTVIEKIKKTMNKLEKARTERMGMIKENPLGAHDHKNKVAELTHTLDELTTKLEMIEKSKKNIQKNEEKEK